jgi:hypothetical protein
MRARSSVHVIRTNNTAIRHNQFTKLAGFLQFKIHFISLLRSHLQKEYLFYLHTQTRTYLDGDDALALFVLRRRHSTCSCSS